jgi:ABC-type nitrate/sulfonate/bicarbonate transport system substrate-binding protein
LDKEDVAALKRRARESYGGNLSAAFSEAARWIRQQEARRRLIDKLGGPSLTAESAAAIDAEQAGGPRYEPKKSKRRSAA